MASMRKGTSPDRKLSLLTSLLFDIERRCDLTKHRLSILDDDETGDYVRSAYQEVETIRRESVALRQDPTLGTEPFRRNQFAQYRLRKQRLTVIEFYTVPFVERFAEADRRLTILCRNLLNQVKWPDPPPLATAFSSQYYWIPSAVDIIAAPAIETMSLLGLPDLCHELGHLLWRYHRDELAGDFINEILAYIREQQRMVIAEQRSPGLRQSFEQLSSLWQDAWTTEFVADMVATYLVGPSFGWQNVRLCAEIQKSAFSPVLGEVSIHPADAARHVGILAVLDKLEDTDGVHRVTSTWKEYLEWSGEAESSLYAICYPNHLILSLASRVVSACRQLGIRSFREAPSWQGENEKGVDIVASVREAWERLLNEPDSYHLWEGERLKSLGDKK